MLQTVVSVGYLVGVACWTVVVARHLRRRVGVVGLIRLLRVPRIRRLALSVARRRFGRRHPVVAAGVGAVVRAARLGS